MKLRNGADWEKGLAANKDPYGGAIYVFAERWANLMEDRMAKGETLPGIAKDTGHEADTDGITGFMYGCAVSALALCWEHGEELRRWHNLDTQLHDEGERQRHGPRALHRVRDRAAEQRQHLGL